MKIYTLFTTSITICIRHFSHQITSKIKEVDKVDEFIFLFCNQTIDLPKLNLLHKILKVARLAISDYIILNCMIGEFLTSNI